MNVELGPKICVFTGSRADYGHLRWLLAEIRSDQDLELQILASGTHLEARFGDTIDEIRSDGFSVTETIEMLETEDTPVGTARSMARGLAGYAEALERMKPDVLVVLGDRYEALAAAEAALILRIPIAHVHGGETTTGAIDDAMRHAISQLADWHFPAAKCYADSLVSMGIDPATIHVAGAPGLDQISRMPRLMRAEFEMETGVVLGTPTLLVTYHPVTAATEDPNQIFAALLSILNSLPNASIVITGANADAGGRAIDEQWTNLAAVVPGRVFVFASLGIRLYCAALALADVVIGNSSSGLIEAPAIGVPTVNIGARQGGRARAPSVIDCMAQCDAILGGISRALSPEVQNIAARRETPYGVGGASKKIKDELKAILRGKLAA